VIKTETLLALVKEADLRLRRRSRMWFSCFFFFFQFHPANSRAMLRIRLRQLERTGVLAVVLLKDSSVLRRYDVSLYTSTARCFEGP